MTARGRTQFAPTVPILPWCVFVGRGGDAPSARNKTLRFLIGRGKISRRYDERGVNRWRSVGCLKPSFVGVARAKYWTT